MSAGVASSIFPSVLHSRMADQVIFWHRFIAVALGCSPCPVQLMRFTHPVDAAKCKFRAKLLSLATSLLLPALLPAAVSAADRDPVAMGPDGRRSRVEQVASGGPLFSRSPFSDVRPGDWAEQALMGLFERNGCIAGYPSGTYNGGRSMTRHEAAALLNACLDRISQVTDELNGLLAEFEPELAVLRGRVDGLEGRVGALEATRFSPTTKISGQASFVLGGNRFGGTADALVNFSRLQYAATTVSYDLQLTMDTSFSGKDLLRANLRAGNFADSSFGGAGPSALSQLEVAFQEDLGSAEGGDVVAIDRLFYQFPLGEFSISIGARIGQEDMLAIWPSAYPADTVLDVLTLGGAPAAYNKNLGAGAGMWWQRNGFSISANYVAAHADAGRPSQGGIAASNAAGTGSVQLGYGKDRWGLAAIYARIQNGNDLIVYATNFSLASYANPGRTDAYGLSGYWQPAQAGWIPSISAGWGLNSSRYARGLDAAGLVSTSQSWSVGLQWQDAFARGNALGMAVGMPVFATRLEGGDIPRDGGVVWEWWYRFRLTDHISVSPAIFYLSRPLGGDTPAGESFRQLGGLVKTSFRF